MKRTFFLKLMMPVVGILVLAACGGSETADEGKVIRRKTVSQNGKDVQMLPKVKADRMLVVELEGMMCVKGCGSSIRSRLYATEGVESVSYDFDEDNPVDVAHIAFDRSKISADEIVEILSTMEKGKYVVKNVKSEPYVPAPDTTASAPSEKRSEKTAKVEIKTTYVETADIFDIFSFF